MKFGTIPYTPHAGCTFARGARRARSELHIQFCEFLASVISICSMLMIILRHEANEDFLGRWGDPFFHVIGVCGWHFGDCCGCDDAGIT